MQIDGKTEISEVKCSRTFTQVFTDKVVFSSVVVLLEFS
jgi:hypothetical protein